MARDGVPWATLTMDPPSANGLEHEKAQILPSIYSQDLSDPRAWLPVIILADSWGPALPRGYAPGKSWRLGNRYRGGKEPLLPQVFRIVNPS